MKYYIDENSNLLEKSGIDYRVAKELQTLEGLRVATDAEVAAVLNPPKSTDEQIAQQSKQARDEAISANISVLDAEWQMVDDARDVRKVLQDADVTGALYTDSFMFRLADNTWRETTLVELKQVLAAHVARKRDVWAQFNAWDSGDKSQPFEVK